MATGKSGKLKVLVDSDVIFDFIAARLPFFVEAEQLFALAEQGLIRIVTLPHLIVNVWQIRGHMRIKNQAMYNSLSKLLTLIDVLDEPGKSVIKALMSKSADLEDWVTVESALFHNVNIIVSRNIKHFKKSPLEAHTPTEFLKKAFPGL